MKPVPAHAFHVNALSSHDAMSAPRKNACKQSYGKGSRSASSLAGPLVLSARETRAEADQNIGRREPRRPLNTQRQTAEVHIARTLWTDAGEQRTCGAP